MYKIMLHFGAVCKRSNLAGRINDHDYDLSLSLSLGAASLLSSLASSFRG